MNIHKTNLFLQDTFVNSFTVCIGKQDTPTPTGLWRVEPKGKMIKPPWYDEYENKTYLPDDPEYPLGPRWVGLEGLEGHAKDRSGCAIHGNNEPETIGTAASRGCVRMRNDDVILIYNLLFPAESKVEIKN